MLDVLYRAVRANDGDNRTTYDGALVVPKFVHIGNYRNFVNSRTYANYQRYAATKFLKALKRLYAAGKQLQTSEE